jgi:hypothetical protein
MDNDILEQAYLVGEASKGFFLVVHVAVRCALLVTNTIFWMLGHHAGDPKDIISPPESCLGRSPDRRIPVFPKVTPLIRWARYEEQRD